MEEADGPPEKQRGAREERRKGGKENGSRGRVGMRKANEMAEGGDRYCSHERRRISVLVLQAMREKVVVSLSSIDKTIE